MRNLKKLRYLNLSENAFSTFPEPVCCLCALIELRITDNQITAFPACIEQLSCLRELHLRNNRLATPEAIGRLSGLRQLDLRGNPLESLPAAIATLPKTGKARSALGEFAPRACMVRVA